MFEHDAVNHPAHYQTESGLEAIDVIHVFFPDNYDLGNVFKYLARAGKKGSEVEDLEKAANYLNWAIEAAKKREQENSIRLDPDPLGLFEPKTWTIPDVPTMTTDKVDEAPKPAIGYSIGDAVMVTGGWGQYHYFGDYVGAPEVNEARVISGVVTNVEQDAGVNYYRVEVEKNPVYPNGLVDYQWIREHHLEPAPTVDNLSASWNTISVHDTVTVTASDWDAFNEGDIAIVKNTYRDVRRDDESGAVYLVFVAEVHNPETGLTQLVPFKYLG